jgi:hypothetical protein
MDYGGASTDHYGGGGGGGGGTIRLACDSCKAEEVYVPDDADADGSFVCSQCSFVHPTYTQLDVDHGDFQGKPSFPPHQIRIQSTKHRKPLVTDHIQRAPAAAAFDDPRDFSPGAADDRGGDPEELGARIRRRYVQGLQVILQQQLEALVERHRVGALGVAGALWLRWVAASKPECGHGRRSRRMRLHTD